MEINIEDYDFESLRNDLIDIIGPATPINEFAQAYLVNASICSDEELIRLALSFNFNLDDYRKYIR